MVDPLTLFLIDDNPDDRALALRALKASFPDAQYIEAGTAAEFAQHITSKFDCAITDYRIGWTNGLQVLREIKQRYPDTPVIMFTNTGSEEVCAEGMKSGLSDYIVKRKEEFPKLPAAVSTALNLAHARRTVKERDSQLAALLESERYARMEAVRANQLKDEFLATVSHELRTPLSAILGWTHILQLERISREQEKEAFRVIERNARAQVKLIEDLLDMSRIISGTLRIELGPLDLLESLRNVINEFKPLADNKRISITTQFDPLPPPVRGDVQRFNQIIGNLLSNAIKFTPEGGNVRITLKRSASQVQITITDTGTGIDTAFLPHLFDRFRQSDMGPTRRHGGLGIGLSVAKTLVEMHGGTIQAFSEGNGTGAKFVLNFPVAVMREEGIQEVEHSLSNKDRHLRLKGLQILAIDDDPDTLEIVERVLFLYGAEVTTARNANEGLAILSQRTFDVLLSDIGMPDMDGFSFIEKLRSQPGPNQNIPASSVTAFSRSQDRERAFLAGFDTHLIKPIEPGELIAVILSLTKRRRSNFGQNKEQQ